MKKMKLIVMLLVLSVCACTIAKVTGKGSLPILLNNPNAKVEVIEHFTKSKSINFDFTNSFDVSDLISEAIAGKKADAIINLNITIKGEFNNFLLNLITLGFANSRTLEVSGDLVSAPNGLGSSLLNGSHEAVNLADLKSTNSYFFFIKGKM